MPRSRHLRGYMRNKRQPREIWKITRKRIWERDGGKCVRCSEVLTLEECHVDHIVPISNLSGTNADSNLRILCRRCHVLRLNPKHRGMIANALRLGIIPPNWRELVWDD